METPVLPEQEEIRDLFPMADAREKELKRVIGKRVKETRVKKGLSRNQLAPIIGLSDGNSLYKYEKGDRGFNPRQLGKIAEALDVTIEWLVHGVEYADRVAAEPPRAASLHDVQVNLAPLGFRLDSDGTIPEPILNLINLGWVNPINNDDILHLRIHLATGGSSLPHDLLVATLAHRLQVDGSEENMRALNEANRRRAEALGGKPLLESEIPPAPATPTLAVGEAPRAKHLSPRFKSRRRSSDD